MAKLPSYDTVFLTPNIMIYSKRGLEIYLPITYWRTSTNLEVDLILGDMEYAIEIKSSATIQNKELRSLRALKEEFSVKKAALICREEICRKTPDEIYIFPWKEFCKILWEKEWIT